MAPVRDTYTVRLSPLAQLALQGIVALLASEGRTPEGHLEAILEAALPCGLAGGYAIEAAAAEEVATRAAAARRRRGRPRRSRG